MFTKCLPEEKKEEYNELKYSVYKESYQNPGRSTGKASV